MTDVPTVGTTVRKTRWTLAALATLVLAAGLAAGCDDVECAQESFVVQENGTCADGPVQLTLSSTGCRVAVSMESSPTGLPPNGAKNQDHRPLRQGGFMLYTNACAYTGSTNCGDTLPAFRLCRAARVGYRLELSCVDASGAPVCQANLTEP